MMALREKIESIALTGALLAIGARAFAAGGDPGEGFPLGTEQDAGGGSSWDTGPWNNNPCSSYQWGIISWTVGEAPLEIDASGRPVRKLSGPAGDRLVVSGSSTWVSFTLPGTYEYLIERPCPSYPFSVSDRLTVHVDLGFPDCNANGIDDTRDIAGGWSQDLNADGLPDECEGLRRPGDASGDGRLDLSDAMWLLGYLFLGTRSALPCEGGTASSPGPGDLAVADFNGDGAIDVSDAVAICCFLFARGKPPALGTECMRVFGCSDRCSP